MRKSSPISSGLTMYFGRTGIPFGAYVPEAITQSTASPYDPSRSAMTMTLKAQCSADCHLTRRADTALIWCEKRGTISPPTCIFLARSRHAIR